MRWSPQASAVPPVRRPLPWTIRPLGCSSTLPPRAVSSAAVVLSRSDSFKRSRPALKIRVSPSAPAAVTHSTGIRSGMGPASMATPVSVLRRTVTASSSVEILAPMAARMFNTARSPWEEARSSPRTVTPSGDRAPIHRKKAALDQSPSAESRSGKRHRWPPEMCQEAPDFRKAIPPRRRVSSVMVT